MDRTILIKAENDSYWKITIPELYVNEFFDYFKELNLKNEGLSDFSVIDWGFLIGSAIGAIGNWLGSKGGTVGRVQSGWYDLISKLQSMGITYQNSKFVYCNHCDGKTYRIWIDNSGMVQYAIREAIGENPRFDCKVIQSILPEIYKALPACNGNGNGLYNISKTTKDNKNTKYLLYGLLGFAGIIILSTILKSSKK